MRSAACRTYFELNDYEERKTFNFYSLRNDSFTRGRLNSDQQFIQAFWCVEILRSSFSLRQSSLMRVAAIPRAAPAWLLLTLKYDI